MTSPKIASVPPVISGSRLRSGRNILALLVCVLCLTALFTVQDAVRRRVAGIPIPWSHVIALNAVDWIAWAMLVPIVVAVGRRIRLDARERRVAHILGWVGLAVGYCALQAAITGLLIRVADPTIARDSSGALRPLGPFLLGWAFATLSFNLLIFGATTAVLHATLYYRDLRDRQLRETELHGRLARAELNVLRMQLQPHFLFNALHTISSLMMTDIPAAQRVVTAVGDLLRSSLDHTAKQEIALRDELLFVRRYLDIQSARFRNRLSVDVDIPEETLGALVPSFVFQPLVENAVRHGIEPHPDGGRIWIRAVRSGPELVLTVENDGATNGQPESDQPDSLPKQGIGLANLQARLRQLYGQAQSFRAMRTQDGGYDVTVTLPFHTDAVVPLPETHSP